MGYYSSLFSFVCEAIVWDTFRCEKYYHVPFFFCEVAGVALQVQSRGQESCTGYTSTRHVAWLLAHLSRLNSPKGCEE